MASLEWKDLKGASITVPAHVVFRALSQETVLLNVQTGQYHGIDEIGARFFEAMQESTNLQAAAVALAEDYDQPAATIEADLTSFVAEMHGFGLVELHSQPPTGQ